MSKETTKMFIVVDKGVVRDVLVSNDADIELVVIDFDVDKAKYSDDTESAVYNIITEENLKAIY